ncbi:MAG: hypothetical protein PHD32_11790, partial [Eubacteriales bacterium]|nr:hypothetical protein [Eubacteriales bacterium]
MNSILFSKPSLGNLIICGVSPEIMTCLDGSDAWRISACGLSQEVLSPYLRINVCSVILPILAWPPGIPAEILLNQKGVDA